VAVTAIHQEIIFRMAKLQKSDCMSIDEAAEYLRISRATLYNYMNVLGVQRLKFPFDRKAYVTKSDIESVRTFVEQNRG